MAVVAHPSEVGAVAVEVVPVEEVLEVGLEEVLGVVLLEEDSVADVEADVNLGGEKFSSQLTVCDN